MSSTLSYNIICLYQFTQTPNNAFRKVLLSFPAMSQMLLCSGIRSYKPSVRRSPAAPATHCCCHQVGRFWPWGVRPIPNTKKFFNLSQQVLEIFYKFGQHNESSISKMLLCLGIRKSKPWVSQRPCVAAARCCDLSSPHLDRFWPWGVRQISHTRKYLRYC
jgi:hypothetical protein